MRRVPRFGQLYELLKKRVDLKDSRSEHGEEVSTAARFWRLWHVTRKYPLSPGAPVRKHLPDIAEKDDFKQGLIW